MKCINKPFLLNYLQVIKAVLIFVITMLGDGIFWQTCPPVSGVRRKG